MAFEILCKALWIALLLKCAKEINLPCLLDRILQGPDIRYHSSVSDKRSKWKLHDTGWGRWRSTPVQEGDTGSQQEQNPNCCFENQLSERDRLRLNCL